MQQTLKADWGLNFAEEERYTLDVVQGVLVWLAQLYEKSMTCYTIYNFTDVYIMPQKV